MDVVLYVVWKTNTICFCEISSRRPIFDDENNMTPGGAGATHGNVFQNRFGKCASGPPGNLVTDVHGGVYAIRRPSTRRQRSFWVDER